MAESPLERGVIWVGANDGPVHVTRDNGTSWTNVTPRDLPSGGRVQNIEASPRRKGAAYIAVYRYLREHDLEPYLYRTDDYGATWTRLTDGTNGIPNDHPARVVREDPEREGLLFAGTEFAIFVSFDNGRQWHSLQQNLPATPVTDIRVHRGDLVISTMGRSFWIMDDIAPLRQIAPNPALTLLQPSTRVRYRRAGGGRGSSPEYPPVALAIDYIVPSGFNGPLTLDIRDASGRPVRSARPGSGRGERPAAPGHNRYLWDYRWSNGGPMAAPGRYTVQLGSQSRTFEVVVDPAVLQDGVTVADLVGQQDFLLSVREAQSHATELRARIEKAMEQMAVPFPPSPGAGESIAAIQYSHPLQRLWTRVVTAPGTYEQGMLIDQLGNIVRAEGGADQKIGAESRRRFDDLLAEMKAVEAELEKIAGGR
jgi:hypothetical protein